MCTWLVLKDVQAPVGLIIDRIHVQLSKLCLALDFIMRFVMCGSPQGD